MVLKKRLVLLYFLVISLGIQAQEMKVADFRADMSKNNAVQFPKKDFNGEYCGLIRLEMAIPNANFEGDIISSEYKNGEWWIYMIKDANWITIKSKKHVPLRCEFSDYGIDGILPNVTYMMKVMEKSDDGEKPVPTHQYLVFKITPPDAVLEVNDKRWEVGTDGTAMDYVLFGNYNYCVQSPNYRAETGCVTVNNPDENQMITINLTPYYGSLSVKSTPKCCTLYVDGRLVGNTPTSVDEIRVGQHEIRLTKDGYADHVETITIVKDECKQVNATLGYNLEVQYTCNVGNALVTIDGQTMNSANGTCILTLGSHSVEAKSKGYYDYEQTINVSNTTTRFDIDMTQNKTETFIVNGVSFKMKFVEGGTFWMGAQDDDRNGRNYDKKASEYNKPVHSVTLSSYYMGETEVTQALWMAVMGSAPTQNNGGWKDYEGIGDDYPAYRITWFDVHEFITKLNQMTGKNFRLPTEAEWEYAARGGKQSRGYRYAGSDTKGDVAWHSTNSLQSHHVKAKLPNELGLYDMCGNVMEWCSDWYGYYNDTPQTNPVGRPSGNRRVLRGGGYMGTSESLIRAEYPVWGRVDYAPDWWGADVGFRLALPE